MKAEEALAPRRRTAADEFEMSRSRALVAVACISLPLDPKMTQPQVRTVRKSLESRSEDARRVDRAREMSSRRFVGVFLLYTCESELSLSHPCRHSCCSPLLVFIMHRHVVCNSFSQ